MAIKRIQARRDKLKKRKKKNETPTSMLKRAADLITKVADTLSTKPPVIISPAEQKRRKREMALVKQIDKQIKNAPAAGVGSMMVAPYGTMKMKTVDFTTKKELQDILEKVRNKELQIVF